MNNKRYTLSSPEVVAVLQDVWRSTKKSYYRIDPVTGRHAVAHVKRELIALGICASIATRLLQAVDLPTAPFVHNRTPAKQPTEQELEILQFIAEVRAEVESYAPEFTLSENSLPAQLVVTEVVAAVAEAAPVPSPSKPPAKKVPTEEQIAKAEKAARAEEIANSKRWQQIQTNSGKHGIWDNDRGAVISLYWTKEEADEELARLKAGSSQAGFYHSSRRNQQADLQEIHY